MGDQRDVQGFTDLVTLTERFFDVHWRAEVLGICPCWVDPFIAARAGPYPNHDQQGCYALFNGPEVRYIGLAASRGSGRYKGHGIGSRIQHVIAVDWARRSEAGERMYKVRSKWAEITHISSIGFGDKGYLASALESYLLGRLNPGGLLNRNRPGAA